jgi:acetolactate decarboxylase
VNAVLRRLWALALPVWIVLAAGAAAAAGAEPGALFQVSTLDALAAGVLDGETSVAELKRHGDFGLGTFNALDGEMIVLDGVVHQVRHDGEVLAAEDSRKLPYAAVTRFRTDSLVRLEAVAGLKDLDRLLEAALPTKNLFYAVRVDGVFRSVKARSVAAQKKPYPGLAKAVENQSVFKLNDVEGSLVGIRCPAYFKGLNLAGFHWHFLSKDRKAGGHVLDCEFSGLTAKVHAMRVVTLVLPEQEDFFRLDLGVNREAEISKAERDPAAQPKPGPKAGHRPNNAR